MQWLRITGANQNVTGGESAAQNLGEMRMSNLFIANCTKQNHIFRFRKPESKSASMIPIPAGQQIKIADLNSADINAIIGPHETYGMTDISAIDRIKDFSGYCYSIDKPVPEKKMNYGVENRMNALAAAGEEMRKLSALANAKTVDDTSSASGIRVNELDVEVEEDSDDPDRMIDKVKFVQEGATEDVPKPKKRRGRGRPRKSV